MTLDQLKKRIEERDMGYAERRPMSSSLWIRDRLGNPVGTIMADLIPEATGMLRKSKIAVRGG